MEVFRTIDIVSYVTQHVDDISFMFEIEGHFVFNVFKQTNHTNGWRGINRSFRVLVIKTHITPSHRRVELAASIAHALYGLHKLIINLGIVRIAEVETVCYTQRLCTTTYNISCGFTHSDHGAFVRISVHVAAVTIRRY